MTVEFRNYRQLELEAAIMTSKDPSQRDPQTRLFPNPREAIMRVLTYDGKSSEHFPKILLRAIYENGVNGLLTFFLKTKPGKPEKFRIIDPRLTEVVFFRSLRPPQDEGLVRPALNSTNFSPVGSVVLWSPREQRTLSEPEQIQHLSAFGVIPFSLS